MSTIDDLKLTHIPNGSAPEAATAVTAFEALIGQSLSEDYRAFLLSFGKSMTLAGNTVAGDGGRSYQVDQLYGVNDSKETLASEWEVYGGRLPDGVIPIGASGGGGQICLALGDAQRPGVFHWDHEREVNERMVPQPPYSNMDLIAATFAELLAKLQPIEDDPNWTSKATKINLRF